MWKYTQTDEMYHSLTGGTLYHSDIYLGQDFSDGIKHYKYLKKVKSKSGKWRYIYDETELKAKDAEIKALNTARDLQREKDGYYKYIDSKGRSVWEDKKGNRLTTNGYKIEGESSYRSNTKKQTEKDKLKEQLTNKIDNTKRAHSKQKMKDIPKRLISRGIGAVNKLLYDIEDKWIR